MENHELLNHKSAMQVLKSSVLLATYEVSWLDQWAFRAALAANVKPVRPDAVGSLFEAGNGFRMGTDWVRQIDFVIDSAGDNWVCRADFFSARLLPDSHRRFDEPAARDWLLPGGT